MEVHLHTTSMLQVITRRLALALPLIILFTMVQASHDPQPSQLDYIPNQGQWEQNVHFRADLQGGKLWLVDNGFTFAFQNLDQIHEIHERYHHKEQAPGDRMQNETVDCHAFSLEFIGANPSPSLSQEHPTPGYYNFFLGQDPGKWATGLKAYQKVRYHDLYSGVDAEVYSQGKNLKYDFILQPGASPDQIQLRYDGINSISIKDENLYLETSVNTLTELKPYAYQIINGIEQQIACNYRLQGNTVTFHFPQGYDVTQELIIDPTLVAATFSGSTSMIFGYTATYDDDGNIYGGGTSFGIGFPTSNGAFQQNYVSAQDHGLNKFNPDGSVRIWSTYLGGGSADHPQSLVVNDQNELIVYGSTSSTNFPTSATAYDANLNGTADITVTHFNATATALIGSTYLGGSAGDGQNGGNVYFHYGDTYRGDVIVTAQGDIMIGSVTQSSDFPVTTNAFQTTYGGGYDGVVCKLSPDLSTLINSSFIGGANDDNVSSLQFNQQGDVYLAGTCGPGFTVSSNAFNNTFQGGDSDAYLALLSSNLQTLNAATFLGTSAREFGYFVDTDSENKPYLLGTSNAQGTTPNYPISPGIFSVPNASTFIHKLDSALTTSEFSTTIGTANVNQSPTAFLVDNCDNIYTSMWGQSNGPFTPNAFDSIPGSKFYLSVLSPGAQTLSYATNFGDSGDHVDGGTSRFDKRGIVYQGVCTPSNTWPTPAWAAEPSNQTNAWDLGIFKFAFEVNSLSAAFSTFTPQNGCAPYPVQFTNNSIQASTTTYLWDFGDNTTSTAFQPTHTYTTPGTYNVSLIVMDTGNCSTNDTAYNQVTILPPPPVTISPDSAVCPGIPVTLSANFPPGATFSWSPGATLNDSTLLNPIANPSATTTYTLTVTDSLGCTGSASTTVEIINITPDPGPPASFCEGEGGAQLQAGPITGGVAPYYYTWWCDSTSTFCGIDSTYDDDPFVNPTATTWYYLQVTDATGCQGLVDSVLVTVLPKPIVDAGPDLSLCKQPSPGGLLTASVLNDSVAPGPYTINWSPALGLNDPHIFNPYARPDTTTIYTCIVESANGCSSAATTVDTTATVTVTVHPQPIADAGPDLHLCYQDSLILQGVGAGAGPQYDFEWSPVTGISDSTAANPIVSPNLTTEYTLTVWSNGCPSLGDPVTVWVHTLPTPSAGNIQEICLGETAQLDAFANGDSSALYTYQWSPSLGLNNPTIENPSASPDTTTLYYLQATSTWGCVSALDSVQVTVEPTPIAQAGNDISICLGDSIQLQGGYTYSTTGPAPTSQIYFQWSPGGTNQPQPWVNPSVSTVYTLQVDHDLCTTYDSVLVTVNPIVAPLLFADTAVTCAGDSVQLHALGGLGSMDFQWIPSTGLNDPSSAEPMAAPDQTTTYQLIAEEGGCISQGELTLQVIPTPEVSFLHSALQGCAPYEVSFQSTSSDAIQYVWDFGDGGAVSNETEPIHLFDTPGIFDVILTGVNLGGCNATTNPIQVEILPPVVAAFDLQPSQFPQLSGAPVEVFVPGAVINFIDQSSGGIVQWEWDFGDGFRSDIQNPNHDYRELGHYRTQLTVWNAIGCKDEILHGPILVSQPELFIPNVFSPNNDGHNDRFLVEYTGSQPFLLEIYDRWGKRLHQSSNKLEGWKGTDPEGKPVPEGVYYYHLKIADRPFAGQLTLVR